MSPTFLPALTSASTRSVTCATVQFTAELIACPIDLPALTIESTTESTALPIALPIFFTPSTTSPTQSNKPRVAILRAGRLPGAAAQRAATRDGVAAVPRIPRCTAPAMPSH
jgi:hypothetical protein